jgi:hypothetical protein
VTRPSGVRPWTASDWLVLAGLLAAPIAGIWLAVAGREHVVLVLVGSSVVLLWLIVLGLAWRLARREVQAAGGTRSVPSTDPGARGPVRLPATAPTDDPPTPDDYGDPRRATLLAIRAAALEAGHEEGVDFVVQGVRSRYFIEPVVVSWRGDLIELGFSEKGSYRPLARVATGEEMQRVLLQRLAPRRPRTADEPLAEIRARWERGTRIRMRLESDPTAIGVPEDL